MFDVESRELEKDIHYYQSCLEALMMHSKEAKIFCLVHKMDLVQEDQREQVCVPHYTICTLCPALAVTHSISHSRYGISHSRYGILF